MSKNLKIVKKRLTNIFVAIVFSLLVFLGLLFFSIKFITLISDDKKSFDHIVFSLNENSNNIESFILAGKRMNTAFGMRGKPALQPGTEDFAKDFFNIIHLDKNNNELNILIKDDITGLDFDNILESGDYYLKTKLSGGFLVTKVHIENNEKVLLIKKIKYGLNDYLTDILSFIFVVLLFSVGLYFIGKKFINKVMEPVEDNIADMKGFVHNAGHELKTPLSVMDSNLQLLDSMKIYDESMSLELKNEVHKLNSIIDALINLSDIDSFSDTEEVNLLDIINNIINSYNSKIEIKNISIKTTIPKTFNVNTNKNNLYIVLSNIIGNAIKYNKQGGKVYINCKNSILTIKDTGIGIDNNNINKVFDRFFKEDSSRSTEGFGIGLALVKKICNIYSWKVELDSIKGKGTTFKIIF